jgi:hypothetical protein
MQERSLQCEARPPNWLPLPLAEEPLVRRREVTVDEGDLFRKGDVSAYYVQQRRGFIRNERGSLIPFLLDEITLLGDARDLEAGLRVGYDVSRTSHGARVTRMKIY